MNKGEAKEEVTIISPQKSSNIHAIYHWGINRQWWNSIALNFASCVLIVDDVQNPTIICRNYSITRSFAASIIILGKVQFGRIILDSLNGQI